VHSTRRGFGHSLRILTSTFSASSDACATSAVCSAAFTSATSTFWFCGSLLPTAASLARSAFRILRFSHSVGTSRSVWSEGAERATTNEPRKVARSAFGQQKILTLPTLMALPTSLCEVISTRAVRASSSQNGGVWNNARMDWTIAGDPRLSDVTGHRIATLEKTTSYSYTTDSWYLGAFAWVFIAAITDYRTYTLMGSVRPVLRRVMSA
jgi:hypothetical protein